MEETTRMSNPHRKVRIVTSVLHRKGGSFVKNGLRVLQNLEPPINAFRYVSVKLIAIKTAVKYFMASFLQGLPYSGSEKWLMRALRVTAPLRVRKTAGF
jgi:hypothetical protein